MLRPKLTADYGGLTADYRRLTQTNSSADEGGTIDRHALRAGLEPSFLLRLFAA